MTIADKVLLLSELYGRAGLARKLGVHPATIARYIDGTIEGRYSTVQKIEELFKQHEPISNCCGSGVADKDCMVGQCKACGEWCGLELTLK